MKIHRLRAFNDNLIFVVEKNNLAMVVDPGDAAPVLQLLKDHNLDLHTILLTHCHNDHIGGVKDLFSKYKARILGPSRLNEFGIVPTQVLDGTQNFEFEQTYWHCIDLPGHTLDHLGYYDAQQKVLFCGDVLFSLGCGRLFEGSFAQGYQSLQKIKDLPIDTQIYCAHEYTLANCNFHIAQKVEPQKEYLELQKHITNCLSQNEDTIPTSLEHELKLNVFLKASSLEEFTSLRVNRNQFKV